MIELSPMTHSQFQAYLEYAVEAYGDSMVRGGNWQAGEAPELAKQTLHDLLPNGLETPGHHLLSVVSATLKQPVGCLWVGIAEHDDGTYAYIYDFVILAPFRRRGYGKAALSELEKKARAMGARMITAHVYSENYVARALYDQIGYTVDQVALTKVVE